jgi:hypothetical protein
MFKYVQKSQLGGDMLKIQGFFTLEKKRSVELQLCGFFPVNKTYNNIQQKLDRLVLILKGKDFLYYDLFSFAY